MKRANKKKCESGAELLENAFKAILEHNEQQELLMK